MRRTLAVGALTVMLMGVAAPAAAVPSDRPKPIQPASPPGFHSDRVPDHVEEPLTGRANKFK